MNPDTYNDDINSKIKKQEMTTKNMVLCNIKRTYSLQWSIHYRQFSTVDSERLHRNVKHTP